MVAVRALQRRVLKLEKVGKPKSSPFTVHFGSIDAFVDEFIIPGIGRGDFDAHEMIDLVSAIRSWEAQGCFAS